jgi:4-amino-4-deoxy-L-arabinose transferase-like glycosyltransferase
LPARPGRPTGAARPFPARLRAALLAGILAGAAVLRLAALGRQSLWFDEAWVVWMVGHGWEAMVTLLRAHDAHPPLYYLLMKAWTGLAGTSEAALRLPSACFGIASVALTYLLARRVAGEPASLLSAALVAVSPFAIMAAQEARMYALMGALAVGSTWTLALAVERGRASVWAAYGVLVWLLLLTHYLGLLVIAAHAIWVAGWARPRLGAWWATAAAAALLYAPWLPALGSQIANLHPVYEAARGLERTGSGARLTGVAGLLAFGGSSLGFPSYLSPVSQGTVLRILVLLPFTLVLGHGVGRLAANPPALAVIGLPPAVALGMMALAPAAGIAPLPRWFSFLVPFYAIMLACGTVGAAARLPRGRAVACACLAAGVVLCNLPVLAQYYVNPRFRPYQWRTAAAVIEGRMQPHDAFIYVGWEPDVVLRYYLPGVRPSLVLLPAEIFGGRAGSGAFGPDQARALARRSSRAWLILTTPASPTQPYMQRRLFPALGNGFGIADGWQFDGIWVYLLQSQAVAFSAGSGSGVPRHPVLAASGAWDAQHRHR